MVVLFIAISDNHSLCPSFGFLFLPLCLCASLSLSLPPLFCQLCSLTLPLHSLLLLLSLLPILKPEVMPSLLNFRCVYDICAILNKVSSQ